MTHPDEEADNVFSCFRDDEALLQEGAGWVWAPTFSREGWFINRGSIVE